MNNTTHPQTAEKLSWQEQARLRLKEGLLILLAVICIYLWMVLLSFDMNDPSFSNSTGHMDAVSNAGGHIGAWIADVSFVRSVHSSVAPGGEAAQNRRAYGAAIARRPGRMGGGSPPIARVMEANAGVWRSHSPRRGARLGERRVPKYCQCLEAVIKICLFLCRCHP